MTNKITIVQGDDASIVIPVTDADGAAVVLTGLLAATFKVKTSINAATNAISKTLGAGVTKTGESELTVTLTDTDTAIAPGNYIFELQVTDADGLISTIRDASGELFRLKILADLD